MSEYLKMSQEIEDEVIEIRRHLHAHPEIGCDLPITTDFVLKKLDEYGIEGKVISDSAITACIGKKGGKTILLRADMDALPVKENLDLEFKSKFDGKMHACGHDMHTSMLLGAAKILKENEDKLEGQIKFMFQPDEEGLGGAIKMIEADILENPKVDFAMALHVFPGQDNLPVGLASIQGGPLLAGSQNFQIDIVGKGGHGGMPQVSVDPIAAANHIYSQLQTIKAREIAATEPLVLSICQFSFGESHNIIPNEGVMKGTMRFFNKEVGKYHFDRIEQIVKSTGELFNCETKVTKLGSTPPTINNTEKAKELEKILKNALGSCQVQNLDFIFTGSEDFAYISERVPSVYIPLVAGNVKDGFKYPVHHPKVLMDERALKYGVTTFVAGAIEWLKNNK